MHENGTTSIISLINLHAPPLRSPRAISSTPSLEHGRTATPGCPKLMQWWPDHRMILTRSPPGDRPGHQRSQHDDIRFASAIIRVWGQ